jgi:hypothetical protein
MDLLSINVNEHTEKKGGLTYLSWAWAWAEVLKQDPLAHYTVRTFGDSPVCKIGDSALVCVTVTVKGLARECWLPVMDNRNNAVKNPDARKVSDAIMRCMTKAVALHGLGLYIYAGEDLPEGEDKPEGEPDIRCKPAEECFKMLQPEVQTFLRKAAPRIEAAMPDAAEVLVRIQWLLENYEPDDRNDVRAGLEHLLDSKTRSAIKKVERETA